MCNILTTILRPNFDDPLDTAQQLVDNNITLYFGPGYESWKYWLSSRSIPEYNKLAETLIITKDWDEFNYYSEHHVIGKGTHAMLIGYLTPHELEMGRWWRSKERLRGGDPNYGYVSNKKWKLNEVRMQKGKSNPNKNFLF